MAAGVAIGCLALGLAATRSRRASRLTDAIALATLLAAGPLIAAGRKATAGPAGTAAPADSPDASSGVSPVESPGVSTDMSPGMAPRVSVLIAARDEAGVLPSLIRDLAAQDHRDPDGSPRFRMLIVDDRSTDGTGALARQAADEAGIGDITDIHRRSSEDAGGPVIDGKGAALDSLPSGHLEDVVMVFDADARISPDVVRRLAAAVGRPGTAATCRRRELGGDLPGRLGLLARVQDDEQTVDGMVQRALWALGGGSEFRGNGMALHRADLEASGGWGTGSVCEDLDLSSRLAARCGIRVRWLPDVVVWEQPVLDLRSLWRQRARWAEGIVRRQLRQTSLVVASGWLGWRVKADHVLYATQTGVPVLMAGTLLGSLAGGSRRPAAVLVGAYLAAGSALGAAALGDAGGAMTAIGRGAAVTVFSASWIPAFVIAWIRVTAHPGRIRFDRTAHRPWPSRDRPDGSDGPGRAGPAGR